MNPDVVKGRIQAFTIPDLGEGLEEVTVTCWNVVVGDHVELNQTLCSVETAKAEVEIPSPYAGRVVEIGGAVGDVLKVGAMLVRIDTQPAAGTQRQVRRRTVNPRRTPGHSWDTGRTTHSTGAEGPQRHVPKPNRPCGSWPRSFTST